MIIGTVQNLDSGLHRGLDSGFNNGLKISIARGQRSSACWSAAKFWV